MWDEHQRIAAGKTISNARDYVGKFNLDTTLLVVKWVACSINNNNNNYGIYIAPYTLAALWRFTILQLKNILYKIINNNS